MIFFKEGTKLLPPHPELTHQANHSAEPFGVLERHKIEELADIQLGQIAGLTFDQNGNLVVFHRAGRFWNQKSVFVCLKCLFDKNIPLILLNEKFALILFWDL